MVEPPHDRGEEWLDDPRHRNLLKNAFFVLLAAIGLPILLALMSAVIFGLVLVGAWFGLWHLEYDQ